MSNLPARAVTSTEKVISLGSGKSTAIRFAILLIKELGASLFEVRRDDLRNIQMRAVMPQVEDDPLPLSLDELH